MPTIAGHRRPLPRPWLWHRPVKLRSALPSLRRHLPRSRSIAQRFPASYDRAAVEPPLGFSPCDKSVRSRIYGLREGGSSLRPGPGSACRWRWRWLSCRCTRRSASNRRPSSILLGRARLITLGDRPLAWTDWPAHRQLEMMFEAVYAQFKSAGW